MKQDSVSDLVTGTGRVTVRAIAAETGLSIATVSRVLNGGSNVASDTRERVRQLVERLGDRAPEPRRRPLARTTRPSVFVRCPYLLTDYFGHIVTSIAETLALHGQGMLLDAGDAAVRSTVVRELPRRGDAYGALLILPPEPRADRARSPPDRGDHRAAVLAHPG
jgi:LacI family transcriptional regulator